MMKARVYVDLVSLPAQPSAQLARVTVRETPIGLRRVGATAAQLLDLADVDYLIARLREVRTVLAASPAVPAESC